MSIAKPTDEELRELFFLFPERKAAADRMPQIEPFRFSDEELDRLMERIGKPSKADAYSRQWVRKKLAEIAEFFFYDYALQEYPMPSETARRFVAIRTAAKNLIQALEPEWGIPFDVQAYLQIAADDYGSRVQRPADVEPQEIPSNFWAAYKVPSAISSVRLIEHWAELAQERLQRNVEENKKAKRTGNRGDPAVRVLFSRLIELWRNVHGRYPGKGNSGPFVNFAGEYIKAMKENLTAVRRSHFENIANKLSHASDEQTIRHYVRVHLEMVAKRAEESRLNKKA